MGAAPSGLKQQLRNMWMAGDFGRIAFYSADEASSFVDRLPISAGSRVLDVACGTGNLAIPAARKGAQVTGLDLAPNLVQQARERAAAESLPATFDEGDAEQMPYDDASFDVVMTMYGAMFAPRPDVTAAELARVCRSGGAIAMANWTPTGVAGKLFAISAKHVPPPPGVEPPVLWGREDVVRERLGPHCSRIETTIQRVQFDYPFPPRDVVAHFREWFGPTKTAFARLDPDGQRAYAADLEALWTEYNLNGADRTVVEAEYLQVHATRS